MPDLVTHTALPWLLGRRFVSTGRLLLVALGAQLPDLMSRVPGLFVDQARHRFFEPAHSLPGTLLLALLVAQVFARDLRRAAFWCLWIGCLTHLALDAMQHNLRGSYHWLLPFSAWHGQLGWMEIEACVPWVPLQIAAVVALEVARARRRGRPAAG